MPSKRIPKKKLACATKETKEGKQYTTCYEKKKHLPEPLGLRRKFQFQKKKHQ